MVSRSRALRWAGLGALGILAACGSAKADEPGTSPVRATNPAPTGVVSPLPATPQPDQPLVKSDIGCLPDLSAASFEQAFRNQLGPLLGLDDPHVYRVAEDRYVWIFHDTYVGFDGPVDTLLDVGIQNNIALIQDGTCFQIVYRGAPDDIHHFELGVGEVNGRRFFWPLGGEVYGDQLLIYWAEMVYSERQPTPESGGIIRHPASTWLAAYDAWTLERHYFGPAPNPGVDPQWGFAVESEGDYSYLFGNPNLLNPEMSGGLANGPHPATRNYLARVPRGELWHQPEYRTADGWSTDPEDAAVISERYWLDNTMQPRLIDGEWWSVTKIDGFWGWDMVLDRADEPWGPWEEVKVIRVEPTFGADVQNTYHPILLPWKDPNGELIVVMSQNAHDWPTAIENPWLYQPSVFTIAGS